MLTHSFNHPFCKLCTSYCCRLKEIRAILYYASTKCMIIFLLFLYAAAASACGNKNSELQPTEGIYRPPTQMPGALPTATLNSRNDQDADVVTRSTPTPVCVDGLFFLQDITIPDGTIVEPKQKIDKRWEIRNSGNCNWDDSYSIKLIAGSGMGVPIQQALPPARSGTEVIIRMILTAPDTPGNYRSVWQAYDQSGDPFGDSIYIDLVVEESGTEPIG